MPIIHIHSPQQAVELPSLEAVLQLNALDHTILLGGRGATADILEPSFSGDITPEVFGLTDIYQIEVDRSGDGARLSLGRTVTGNLVGIQPSPAFHEVLLGNNGLRIPEDGETIPLMWEKQNPFVVRPRYLIGGLITCSLNEVADAQRLVDSFRR